MIMEQKMTKRIAIKSEILLTSVHIKIICTLRLRVVGCRSEEFYCSIMHDNILTMSLGALRLVKSCGTWKQKHTLFVDQPWWACTLL